MKRFLLEIMGSAVLAAGLAYAQREPAAQTASSRVNVWLVDPSGAVDGLLLRDGRAFWVPRDAARNLTLAVRITDPVRIESSGGRRYLVDERDDSRVDITPAPGVARGGGPSAALQRLVARGEAQTFVRGAGGALAGIILSTGEQVRVPLALSPRLSSVRQGDMITVEGLGARGPYGTGIEALTITDAQGRTLLRR